MVFLHESHHHKGMYKASHCQTWQGFNFLVAGANQRQPDFGCLVGTSDCVGDADDVFVGASDGACVGVSDGACEGAPDGACVGRLVGRRFLVGFLPFPVVFRVALSQRKGTSSSIHKNDSSSLPLNGTTERSFSKEVASRSNNDIVLSLQFLTHAPSICSFIATSLE